MHTGLAAIFTLIATPNLAALVWGPSGWQNSRLAPEAPLAQPAQLVGTWTGSGVQRSQRSSSWSIVLRVRQEGAGAYSYKVDYPSVGCGGFWTLNAPFGTFAEHIDYGVDDCVDLGRIWIVSLPDGRIAVRWTGRQGNGYPESAEAILARVQ